MCTVGCQRICLGIPRVAATASLGGRELVEGDNRTVMTGFEVPIPTSVEMLALLETGDFTGA